MTLRRLLAVGRDRRGHPDRRRMRRRRRLGRRGRHDHRRRLQHGRALRHRRGRGVPRRGRRRRHRRHLRHGRRLRALLPRRDRPLERLAADQGRGGGDLRGERRRVRRAPGRQRRAHGRRQHGERLGDLPHGRRAERDLEARLEGEQLEPGPSVDFPDEPLKLFGAGTDSGTFDYFTDVDQRRGGREPHRLLGQRGRQRHRPGRQRLEGRPRATSASRTSRRTRTRSKALEIDGGSGLCRAERRDARRRATTSRFRDRSSSTSRRSRSSGTRWRTSCRYMLDNETTIAEQAQFVPLNEDQLAEAEQKLEDATGLGRERPRTSRAAAVPARRGRSTSPVEPPARRARRQAECSVSPRCLGA